MTYYFAAKLVGKKIPQQLQIHFNKVKKNGNESKIFVVPNMPQQSQVKLNEVEN